METLAFWLLLASAFLFMLATCTLLFDLALGYTDRIIAKHFTGD